MEEMNRVRVLMFLEDYSQHLGRFPASTAWRILGLRMEEQPPAMEGSCEYTEYADK
jgi:hypothetical protein